MVFGGAFGYSYLMHRILSFVLVGAIILTTGYWYHAVHSKCQVPVTYRIGSIDESFGLTEDEVRMAVADAESLWENASGQNLFTYDPEGVLTINFIFDERQALTEEEHTLRDVLDRKESLNSDLHAEYEELVDEYERLKRTYISRVAQYENALAIHNGEVAYWNNRGGAPESVYSRLNAEERRLSAESRELSGYTDRLNELVDDINLLGEESSARIRDYNNTVRDYNDRFTQGREFTQGDYYRDTINIYQFKDAQELRLVLAHELGHALSLGHVEDAQSIMHHLMEGQHENLMLSESDIAELNAVCGAR